MKAIEIREHFLSRSDWVDRNNTVDQVIIGDPQKDVRRVLVTWISSLAAVRRAIDGGFDMLMTHEPTFYVHARELERAGPWPIVQEKRRLIEASGLVILRNHDVWDRFPEVGIPWAWARFLGLATPPAAIGADGYQHRYDIGPIRLEAMASRIAGRTATIGEPAVQVVGDPERLVSKIGVGTGCACNIEVFQEMGCDAAVACDDGSTYWSNMQRAADMGYPVIRVNHGTSEEPGMRTLAQYVNDHLPGVTAEHLPHGCCFGLVSATPSATRTQAPR